MTETRPPRAMHGVIHAAVATTYNHALARTGHVDIIDIAASAVIELQGHLNLDRATLIRLVTREAKVYADERARRLRNDREPPHQGPSTRLDGQRAQAKVARRSTNPEAVKARRWRQRRRHVRQGGLIVELPVTAQHLTGLRDLGVLVGDPPEPTNVIRAIGRFLDTISGFVAMEAALGSPADGAD